MVNPAAAAILSASPGRNGTTPNGRIDSAAPWVRTASHSPPQPRMKRLPAVALAAARPKLPPQRLEPARRQKDEIKAAANG